MDPTTTAACTGTGTAFMLDANVECLGDDAVDHVVSDHDDDSDSSPPDTVEGDDGVIRSDRASSISSEGLSRSPVRNDIWARVRVFKGLSSSLYTRVLRREGYCSIVVRERGTGSGVAWVMSVVCSLEEDVRGLAGGVAKDASAEEGVV